MIKKTTKRFLGQTLLRGRKRERKREFSVPKNLSIDYNLHDAFQNSLPLKKMKNAPRNG